MTLLKKNLTFTQATTTEQTVKRGRGRPRKNPLEIVEASSESKRGRGRPRKNPEIAFLQDESENSQSKRGPGRPRKNFEKSIDLLVQKEDTASEVENASLAVLKRGRGRPRKHPIKDTSANPMNETDQPKRGRGRPRKNPEIVKKSNDIVFMSAKSEFIEDKPFQFVLNENITDKTPHEILIENETKRQRIVSFKVGSNSDNVYKPSISHLANAFSVEYTEKGRNFTFNSNIGDKITIEYPQNWRRTEEWIIDDINYENGDLRLKHYIEGYYASSNYIVGPTIYGLKIKKVS
jgi:hypothetical protein